MWAVTKGQLVTRCLALYIVWSLPMLCVQSAWAQDQTRVKTVEVETRPLQEEISLTGSVSSPRQAAVSVAVAGLIAELPVDAGDAVNKGDILLELDPELARIARDSAQAAVARARETLADSQRRLDEARNLEADNNIAASEVRSREAQAAVDAANLQMAEAELHQRQAELQRHRLKAPFTGTLSRKLAEVGEWVNPGTAVLELVATQGLRLDFQVPQRFFPRVEPNTTLSVDFDAYPDQTFTARVHRKVPLSQQTARAFLLRAMIQGDEPELIPGMSLSGRLLLDVDRESPMVPRDALQRYPDGRVSVWVLAERDRETGTAQVVERQVETGLSFANSVEIRSGLEVGQRVVTRGNEALQEGQTVQIE